MKKIIVIIAIALVLPAVASAHPGSLELDKIKNWPGMVHYVEDLIVDEGTHAEMEKLANRMMTRKLTHSEAERFAQLAQENPSSVALMMQRVIYEHQDFIEDAKRASGFSTSSLWGPIPNWLLFIGVLTWVVVGLMLIVRLASKKE